MEVSPSLKDGRYFGRLTRPTKTPTISRSRRSLTPCGLREGDRRLTRLSRLEEDLICVPEETLLRFLISILVFMHNVVTRFRVEKAIPSEKMMFRGRATLAHGLPVYLHSHPK